MTRGSRCCCLSQLRRLEWPGDPTGHSKSKQPMRLRTSQGAQLVDAPHAFFASLFLDLIRASFSGGTDSPFMREYKASRYCVHGDSAWLDLSHVTKTCEN